MPTPFKVFIGIMIGLALLAAAVEYGHMVSIAPSILYVVGIMVITGYKFAIVIEIAQRKIVYFRHVAWFSFATGMNALMLAYLIREIVKL